MTLTLRSRLTLIYTAVFGVLLVATSVASYEVLAYQLDADVTTGLAELTTGLHGYLRFAEGTPTLSFDPSDPAQAAFVEEATRYFQVFDAVSGQLLVQSDALKPLGLEFSPPEVRQLRDSRLTHDVHTDYGRLRLSNNVLPANGRSYLLQVVVSLDPMDRALERFPRLRPVTFSRYKNGRGSWQTKSTSSSWWHASNRSTGTCRASGSPHDRCSACGVSTAPRVKSSSTY